MPTLQRHFILVLTLLQILSAVFLPVWLMLDQNREHIAAHWLQQNHHHHDDLADHHHDQAGDDGQSHLMLDEFSNNPPDLVRVYQVPSLNDHSPLEPRFTLLSCAPAPDGFYRPPRLS